MSDHARSTDFTEGDTRRRIMQNLLKHGPITASDLGSRLGISATGVRRHLDILAHEGLAETVIPQSHRREPSRGRPAKSYRLTERGREIFGHDYDNLAVLALQTLRETGGKEAIKALARRRIAAMVAGISPAGDSRESVEETAIRIARAFDDHGYAATVKSSRTGVQLCQHHCPVSHVAAEYPELCEAEHEIIAELTGGHIQPLASIANGNGVCTTNIPLIPINTPGERSGS